MTKRITMTSSWQQFLNKTFLWDHYTSNWLITQVNVALLTTIQLSSNQKFQKLALYVGVYSTSTVYSLPGTINLSSHWLKFRGPPQSAGQWSKQFQVSSVKEFVKVWSIVNSFPLSTPTFASLRTLSDQSIDTQYTLNTQSSLSHYSVNRRSVFDLRSTSLQLCKLQKPTEATHVSVSFSLSLSLFDLCWIWITYGFASSFFE